MTTFAPIRMALLLGTTIFGSSTGVSPVGLLRPHFIIPIDSVVTGRNVRSFMRFLSKGRHHSVPRSNGLLLLVYEADIGRR